MVVASAHPRRLRGRHLLALVAVAALGATMAPACDVSTEPSVDATALGQELLGTAQSFAVLGGSTVTNTGSTTVYGSLGVHPGLAVTGFPPGLVTGGTIHSGDAVALQAQSDTTAAYDALAAMAPTADLTGQDLGGMTLVPGVYSFSSSAQLTGQLTLDAMGDPDAVFVFQIGSTLTTASNSSVLVIGGQPCNVYWLIGSSATLGTTTALKGNILAVASITLDTGATLSGRALARTAAVTMDDNDVSILECPTLGDGGGGTGGGDTGGGGTGGTGTGTGGTGTGSGTGGTGTGGTGTGGSDTGGSDTGGNHTGGCPPDGGGGTDTGTGGDLGS
jgi:hypothetical protein